MTSSFENWSGLQAASAGFPGKKLLQGCLVLPNYHLSPGYRANGWLHRTDRK